MRRIILFTLLVSGLMSVTSCSKTSSWDKEMEQLKVYLENNNITVDPTYSGMYYIETKAGMGPSADGGDKVKVKYTGTFLDGEEFDSGVFEFQLGIGQVIRGWDEGINYMNEGGKAILIIPSNLAYGSAGSGPIPGYSTLVFHVELLDVY